MTQTNTPKTMQTSEKSLPDYQNLQLELTSASLSVTPAELQGLLAGMLSGGVPSTQNTWQTLLADYTNDGMSWPINAQKTAESVYAFLSAELNSTDMMLSLLLPTDDNLVEYAEAVSDWVTHFISGIGLAGQGLVNVSADVKEALRDLEEIAKLGIDEEDDFNEQALLLEQVIEHVKVCVLTIYAELGNKEQGSKALSNEDDAPIIH